MLVGILIDRRKLKFASALLVGVEAVADLVCLELVW